MIESSFMGYQNHSFLEPSAVRNLEKLLGGYTSHPGLKGYSSKPKTWRPPPKREQGLMAQTRHGATLEEVGQERGVTREWVRQIEAAALKKCRLWCIRHGYRLEDLLGA